MAVPWGNEAFVELYELLPELAGRMICLGLLLLLAVDVAATLYILSGKKKRASQWEEVDLWLTEVSQGLSRWIYARVARRLKKAYPVLGQESSAAEKETHADVFAYGCSFYKLVWLFVIGAFLGDLTETVFCKVTAGVWMSRSSVVWGPFSLVWGIAMAVATLLLYRYKERSDGFLFIVGTFLGGAYEYVCSVFTELVFGKVFWDYSKMPFNLGGRINLLYCFFWGLAAVVWMKGIYPHLSAVIEKIPQKAGVALSWIVILFFCANIAVSSLALIRSAQREQDVPAKAGWQKVMDDYYGDEKLEKIYPNALTAGK